MKNTIGAGNAQLLTNKFQYLEVIVLFIAYHVYAEVAFEFVLFYFGQPNILGNVNGSTIAAANDLFIEAVFGKVNPGAAILFQEEYFLAQAFFNQFFTQ